MNEQQHDPNQPAPSAQTSQAILRSFYDSVPIIMGVAELDGDAITLVSGNRHLAELYGTSPEKLVGKTAADISGSRDFQRLRLEHYRRAQCEGVPVRFDFADPRPGQSRWFSSTITYIGLGMGGKPQFGFIIEDISARKRADEQLRASEERFRALFHASPAAQAITGYERGEFLDANDAYCRLVGYARADLVGKTTQEAGLTVLLGQREPLLQELERDDFTAWLATDIRVRSGEIRSVLGSVRPIEWQGQRCLISSVLDITAQIRSSQALRQMNELLEQRVADRTTELRESEQRFGAIFEQSPIPMAVICLRDTRYVDVNAALLKLSGYARDDIVGRISAEQGAWFDDSARVRFIAQLDADGYVANFETTLFHSSGRSLDVLMSAQIIEIAQEQYLISQIIDITERKRFEKLLREREHFISAVVKTAPAIIYVYDLKTRRNVFINDGLTRVMGYPDEQLRIMGSAAFRGIVHPDDWARARTLQDALAAGEIDVLESEVRARHQTGGWRVMRACESPFLRNADGTLRQKIGVAIDITEQKQTQRELEQSHEQLHELSRQLIETQEVERRAIGRELHDEIGQNLTGLKIMLELALSLPPDEARPKLALALQVANDLLDRASRLVLNLRPPMLDDMGLLPALLWLTQNISAQTAIQLDFTHSGVRNQRFAPAIETAIYRLAQEALTNIARHAATKQASMRLSATPASLDLLIQDFGAGFDAAVVRARHTSGLFGMAERVSVLGGEFAIRTTPGGGTSIVVSIPRAEKE